jgi:hypothetical protein
MAFRHLETSLQQIHQSRFLRPPEGWLWVLKAIRLPKTSLPRIRPKRFLKASNLENEKEWYLDIMIHRFIDT